MKRYPSIAVVEFGSIADGICCTDALLKKAPIAMLKSGTVSGGRYLIIIGGSTGAVEESLNEALASGEASLLHHAFLPDIHDQVHESVLGRRQPVIPDAVAVLETTTVAANVRAAELALKGIRRILRFAYRHEKNLGHRSHWKSRPGGRRRPQSQRHQRQGRCSRPPQSRRQRGRRGRAVRLSKAGHARRRVAGRGRPVPGCAATRWRGTGQIESRLDQAKTRGVRHIVLTSALGVDAVEEAPLRKVERHLMRSGVPYTILRPNFFMENFSTGFLAPMLKQGGIFLAAADGKTSFISVLDIAAVAAATFVDGLTSREFNLTRPEPRSSPSGQDFFMISARRLMTKQKAPIRRSDRTWQRSSEKTTRW